jgi:aminoglycoside phosphotransferase (APT) family kinase protein
LQARWPDATEVRVGELDRCTAGYSADTFIFDAHVVRDGEERDERYVLRKETPEPAVYPQQVPGLNIEVEIQYRAMDGIAEATDVPLAPLVGFERDATVLGQPFFVMGFIEGVVPTVQPSYVSEGFFADAAADERRRMIDDGLRVLAQLHRMDWRAAGFDWLVAPGTTPGTAAQLDIWEQYFRRELGDRNIPLFDESLDWLRAKLPADESLSLNWGDARLGNMIWQGFTCACVTDFENAAIAPPEMDLGWWLMFDRWSHEASGLPNRADGDMARDEQRQRYETFFGRSFDNAVLHYHEVFAALRYAAIVVRVMNRTVDRGLMPADHTMWRENAAIDCLVVLLEER